MAKSLFDDIFRDSGFEQASPSVWFSKIVKSFRDSSASHSDESQEKKHARKKPDNEQKTARKSKDRQSKTVIVNGTSYTIDTNTDGEEVIKIGNSEIRISCPDCSSVDVIVNVIGYIDGEISTMSGDVVVHSDACVRGLKSVKTMSGDVRIDGDVEGCESVATASGDVYLYGNLTGSIKTVSGAVNVDGDVSGDINTVSGDIR